MYLKLTCSQLFCFLAYLIVYVEGAPSPLVDLTYVLGKDSPIYPGLQKFELENLVNGSYRGYDWFTLNNFCSSEHVGTHIDAPNHFWKKGKTVDQIPYERLYRVPGIKIDVTCKTENNPDYLITAEDIQKWIADYGEFPDGVVVLFETGWGKFAHNNTLFAGIDRDGLLHYPSIGKEAGEWLAEYHKAKVANKREGIVAVGVDVLSLDSRSAPGVPVHLSLLSNDIYGIENVMDMKKLPHFGFTLTMLPMKIGGGSGAPTRMLAELGGVPRT